MGLCSHRNLLQSYNSSREPAVATNLLGFFLHSHSHSHDHDLPLQLTRTLELATSSTRYLPPTRTRAFTVPGRCGVMADTNTHTHRSTHTHTNTQTITEPITYAPSAEAYSPSLFSTLANCHRIAALHTH